MTEQPTAAALDQPAPRVRAVVSLVALYLLLVVVPILLKLTHFTRVATWPWLKVLLPLWAPWGMLVALSLGGWLLRWASRLLGRA